MCCIEWDWNIEAYDVGFNVWFEPTKDGGGSGGSGGGGGGGGGGSILDVVGLHTHSTHDGPSVGAFTPPTEEP